MIARPSRRLLVCIALLALGAGCERWRSQQRLNSFKIPSEGMAPTLIPGDYFLVDQWAFVRETPVRGDVVVYRMQTAEGRVETRVQRVLAVPGDTIEFRGDATFLNGELIETEVAGSWRDSLGVHRSLFREHLGERTHLIATAPAFTHGFPTVTVEPGHYFMVGDNRENSMDSRRVGTIPAKDIVGRATHIYFSSDWRRIWKTIE